jgi:hypothetical protein
MQVAGLAGGSSADALFDPQMMGQPVALMVFGGALPSKIGFGRTAGSLFWKANVEESIAKLNSAVGIISMSVAFLLPWSANGEYAETPSQRQIRTEFVARIVSLR